MCKILLEKFQPFAQQMAVNIGGLLVCCTLDVMPEYLGVCLCSAVDVSAAENIGRVLAQRCLQSGITSMLLQSLDNSDKSERVIRHHLLHFLTHVFTESDI